MNDWAIVHEAPNTTPRHHVRFLNKIKTKKHFPFGGRGGWGAEGPLYYHSSSQMLLFSRVKASALSSVLPPAPPYRKPS